MELTLIAQAAQEFELKAYLVGGAVRDHLQDTEILPADLDFVLVGNPQSIDGFAENLAAKLNGERSAYSQFGTFKIHSDSQEYEFAPARTETYPSPGDLPVVTTGQGITIEADLRRRDFGINALAMEVTTDGLGNLVDPLGVQDDICIGSIRTLHPESFQDDPTRIFRALRFAGRFGYEVEPKTAQQMAEALHYINTLSGARVLAEIKRISEEPRLEEIMKSLQDYGVLDVIGSFSEITERALSFTRQGHPETLVAILAYHALDTVAFADRLTLPKHLEKVALDITSAKTYGKEVCINATPSEVYRNLHGIAETAIEVACHMTDDSVRSKFRHYLDHSRFIRPEMNGNDILALGVPQGPRVGQLITALRNAKLDGLITTREQELEFVQRRHT